MGINAGIGVKSSSNVSIGSDSGQNTDGVGKYSHRISSRTKSEWWT